MDTNKSLSPVFNLDFDGSTVTSIRFRGRWCWVAVQVGQAIGYTSKDRFAAKFTSQWASEFIPGQDFDVLRYQELKDFLQIEGVTTTSGVSSDARNLTIIYESGLHLSLLKTRKPAGKKLRRVLAEKVLPQLVRDGRYAPQRIVAAEGELVDTASGGREDRRLSLQEAELDLRRRQIEAGALRELAETLRPRGRVGEDVLESLEVTAAEIESGRPLLALKPPADEFLDWESPTQIATRLGVTVQRVGRTISALGLRGDPQWSRAIVNKALHSDRTVTSYLYSPAAAREVEAAVMEVPRG